MSPARLIVAGLILAVLAGLLGWQVHRERLVRACVETGGLWHGARSQCVRPILRRDYQRSEGVGPLGAGMRNHARSRGAQCREFKPAA
jgi:hypothetical protein